MRHIALVFIALTPNSESRVSCATILTAHDHDLDRITVESLACPVEP